MQNKNYFLKNQFIQNKIQRRNQFIMIIKFKGVKFKLGKTHIDRDWCNPKEKILPIMQIIFFLHCIYKWTLQLKSFGLWLMQLEKFYTILKFLDYD